MDEQVYVIGELPWNVDEAAKQIVDQAKKQYDPEIAKEFRGAIYRRLENIDKDDPTAD